MGCSAGLPPDPPGEELLSDEAFLQAYHHALLEVHLAEGALVCPETGRKFPVSNGIPNMLLREVRVYVTPRRLHPAVRRHCSSGTRPTHSSSL